jgi:outer membrane lipoprotein-sorting protein
MSRLVAVLSLLLVAAPPSSAEDPHALLVRADRVRNAWPEVVLSLRVTTQSPNGPSSSGEFRVFVKEDRARVEFLDPKDAGKVFVTSGKDAWLFLPTTKNPIRVPKSHRLRGGFAAADISKTRFADDYDAVIERTEELGGRTCDVIRLATKKGKDPTYPVVRVWVDPKDGLYRKAVFLLASGKTAKEVTFDEYRPYRGVLSIAKMTIVDTLRPGTTVVEYLDYEKKSVPDSVFQQARS